MKSKIHIHPLTIPFFIFIYFTPLKNRFFILYIFILLHELSHAALCLICREKIQSLNLLPWGCVLSLASFPQKICGVFIFFAGPLFNLAMCFFGIFPKENLSLALFNLIPIAPLDGGVIINLLCPKLAFYVSVSFIVILSITCICTHIPPYLPVILTILLIVGEKSRLDKTINLKVISYFTEKN